MTNQVAREHRNRRISRAAYASAEARKCPKCSRGAAIKIDDSGGWPIRYCRWKDCDYVHTLPAPESEAT